MPRIAPEIVLDTATKAKLKAFVRAPSTPQAFVRRAQIVLAAAEGLSNKQVAAQLGIPPVTVGKWRSRFARHGLLEGLRDEPRPGRPCKHDCEVWWDLLSLRSEKPPVPHDRWSVRSLAREIGLPRSTVHEMLVANRLQRLRKGKKYRIFEKNGT
jgi:transposase